MKVKDGGNQFLARLALEGAVLLLVFREENALLYRAIGLLLEDFPALPNHPHNSADLAVKAIQLLGHFYDRYPHDQTIVAKIIVFCVSLYCGARNARKNPNFGSIPLCIVLTRIESIDKSLNQV